MRLVDAGHLSFTDFCRFNPAAGDGCGTGARLDGGEAFEFLDWATATAITQRYEVALFGRYLRGIEAYDADLAKNAFTSDLDFTADP